jgi:hypothetical protein
VGRAARGSLAVSHLWAVWEAARLVGGLEVASYHRGVAFIIDVL